MKALSFIILAVFIFSLSACDKKHNSNPPLVEEAAIDAASVGVHVEYAERHDTYRILYIDLYDVPQNLTAVEDAIYYLLRLKASIEFHNSPHRVRAIQRSQHRIQEAIQRLETCKQRLSIGRRCQLH